MNPNADYLGIVTMLRSLLPQAAKHGDDASQPAGAGSRQRQRSQKNRRAAEGTAWRRHHYFSLISSLLG